MTKALLIPLLFLATLKLAAQPYYFSQNEQLYTNLSGSTSINTGSTWSGFQSFTLPIGFTFSFMNNSYTSVKLEATGRLIFDANHFYYADMFVVSGMKDKGSTSSLSPLSYQLTGASGNQILKIEINNATYQNDPSSTINYQIWLYEQSSIIELHMGPNSINNPSNAFSSGSFSGVFNVTTYSPLTYGYGLALFNTPSAPSDTTFSGTGISMSGITLNNAPTDSTVYRFSVDSLTTNVSNSIVNTAFKVYPNPSTGKITLQKPAGLTQNIQLRLMDVTSKLILEKTIPVSREKIEIDLSPYCKGLYYLHITMGDAYFVEKLLKE